MKISTLSSSELLLVKQSFLLLISEQEKGHNILKEDTLIAIKKFLKDINLEFTKEEYGKIIIALKIYFVTRMQKDEDKYWKIITFFTNRYNKLYGVSPS
jgi:hypothetical protein